MRLSSLLPLMILLATLAALSGCGGDDDGSLSLTVYSGRSEELVGPLLEGFEKASGVDVKVRYGDSAEVALLLQEEGDKTPADVILTQSPTPLSALDEDELLAPMPAALSDLVPEQFRGTAGSNWIGITGRGRTLVINTDAVSETELPSSVFDLSDERYAGRVAVAPENGSFQEFVAVAVAEFGVEATSEWLGAMAENNSPGYPKNTAIVDAVARGEVDMGLVNGYYVDRALAESPDLPITTYAFPGDDIGSLVLPSAAAITASGDTDTAGSLIGFLLNDESQGYFQSENQEYPLAGPGAVEVRDVFPFPRDSGDLAEVVNLISESKIGS